MAVCHHGHSTPAWLTLTSVTSHRLQISPSGQAFCHCFCVSLCAWLQTIRKDMVSQNQKWPPQGKTFCIGHFIMSNGKWPSLQLQSWTMIPKLARWAKALSAAECAQNKNAVSTIQTPDDLWNHNKKGTWWTMRSGTLCCQNLLTSFWFDSVICMLSSVQFSQIERRILFHKRDHSSSTLCCWFAFASCSRPVLLTWFVTCWTELKKWFHRHCFPTLSQDTVSGHNRNAKMLNAPTHHLKLPSTLQWCCGISLGFCWSQHANNQGGALSVLAKCCFEEFLLMGSFWMLLWWSVFQQWVVICCLGWFQPETSREDPSLGFCGSRHPQKHRFLHLCGHLMLVTVWLEQATLLASSNANPNGFYVIRICFSLARMKAHWHCKQVWGGAKCCATWQLEPFWVSCGWNHCHKEHHNHCVGSGAV